MSGTANVATPTRAPRVFEAICDQLRDKLSRGDLQPGDKLPSERDLAESYGASRAAVREALRNLERGGVVEQRRGVKGGTFVRQADSTQVSRSLNDLLSVGGISIASLTESRTIVQSAVVRLACERGTKEDFDLLDQSLDRTALLTRQGHLDERRVQLLQFYRLLGRATHNDVMVILVESLTDMVLTLLARSNAPPRTSTVRTHRQIVRCLREGDPDRAQALMTTHLTRLHSHFSRAAADSQARKP
ncbi:FadR/GntR family transcriptional regulator [Variovorax sp. J22P168]|uniref:FadR/GntR family transcriptional regulator n=1 Tax=Variovorax jilinensis TaxID=3053513 RepID=UPI0025754AA8|nr:FadR/GntR family transcriptional regulator [Variovorax sp. J22P168]MDM0015178.1 FadR/GntR family transcriptional regulator [Variovorax sp. J22P168]